MASTGKEKWGKYFASGDIETKVTAPKGHSSVNTYDADGVKTNKTLPPESEIKVLQKSTYTGGKDPFVFKAKDGSLVAEVVAKKLRKTTFVKFNDIAKPDTGRGPTEALGIQANTLILKGVSKRMDVMGKKNVTVRSFKNATILAQSIMHGLTTNIRVKKNPLIIEIFTDYFAASNRDKRKIDMSELTSSTVNELGKYMGEVVIGYLLMSKETRVFTPFVPVNPSQIAEFVVPDDPSFEGVDSFFVVLRSGKKIPISSKFGVGAKASFFANLMAPVLKHRVNPSPSNTNFAKFVKFAYSRNFTEDSMKRDSKKLLYEYGVWEILKIPKGKIPNPQGVLESIRKDPKRLTKEASMVIAAIRKHRPADPLVIKALPQSVTAFFTRTLADQLNKEKKSIDQMKEILSGKDFIQANLNIPKWKRGEIEFRLLRSGETKLKIIGNKSSVTDLAAKQGLINYELQTPK